MISRYADFQQAFSTLSTKIAAICLKFRATFFNLQAARATKVIKMRKRADLENFVALFSLRDWRPLDLRGWCLFKKNLICADNWILHWILQVVINQLHRNYFFCLSTNQFTFMNRDKTSCNFGASALHYIGRLERKHSAIDSTQWCHLKIA